MKPIAELQPQGKKAIAYLNSKGFKISKYNIIYFEGINTDLVTVNDDRINGWNDVRSIISDTGEVLVCCAATTEPGWYYRQNRLNSEGAAQLAFGQHLAAWEIGDHKGQLALVQCGNLKIYRDGNEDGLRKGDPVFVGDNFGLNQHTTTNAPDLVGRWSAGCLVGQFSATHYNIFMPIVKQMGVAKFDTTLIPGDEFAKFN
jgi:hypothetical protein